MHLPMNDVVCLGILVADIWGRPIDSWPQKGRLSLVKQMGIGVGGCAANTGLSLVKLGVSTAVMGKLGRDGFGTFVADALKSAGVDVSGIGWEDEVNTSATMIMIDSAGERSFLHCIGANATVRPQELNMEMICSARVFDLGGLLVMPGFDGEPAASVLKAAKQAGVITCMDTVWDDTGRWMELVGPCLPYADYFLPSLPEAIEITGEREPEKVAQVLLDHGVGTAVLKMGAEGCYVRNAERELRLPAYQVQVIDGTGSGDAFVAGFIQGLLKGWDLEDTARFANAVGALCVTGIGTTAGVRDFNGTIDFLVEHEGERWEAMRQ